MKANAMRQLFYFPLFLALAFAPSACLGLVPGTKQVVRFLSFMYIDHINYHCRTPHEDLGPRVLTSGSEAKFQFLLAADTVYTCDISDEAMNATASFKVFEPTDEFINRCGGDQCIWRVLDVGSGFYSFNIKTGKWEHVLDWTQK